MSLFDFFNNKNTSTTAIGENPSFVEVLELDDEDLRKEKQKYFGALEDIWIRVFLRDGTFDGSRDLSPTGRVWLCADVLILAFFIEVITKPRNTPLNALDAGKAFLAKVVLERMEDREISETLSHASAIAGEVWQSEGPPLEDWQRQYFEVARHYVLQPSDLARMGLVRLHDILRYALAPAVGNAPERMVDDGAVADRLSPLLAVVSAEGNNLGKLMIPKIEELSGGLDGWSTNAESEHSLEAGLASLMVRAGGRQGVDIALANEVLADDDPVWFVTYAAILQPALRNVIGEQLSDDGWTRLVRKYAKGLAALLDQPAAQDSWVQKGTLQARQIARCDDEAVSGWIDMYGASALALAESPGNIAVRNFMESLRKSMRWWTFDHVVQAAGEAS